MDPAAAQPRELRRQRGVLQQRRADPVADGRLCHLEVGPHDQLMESQGPYWRLYEAQARRAEEDAQAAGLQIATPHSRRPAGKV